jgi:hypothetical protein
MANDDTEFGLGPGVIPAAKIALGPDALTAEEERMMIMATDPSSTDEPDPARVGLPASYARDSNGWNHAQ